jgi:nitrate reductase gamma subunit
MRQNKDGTIIADRKELLNPKCKITVPCYPLIEYELYILLKNKDSVFVDYSEKIAFMAFGALLQLIVLVGMFLYYRFSHNMKMFDSTLFADWLYKIILILVCAFIALVLFVLGKMCNSEKKQLISKIKSHLKEE